MVEEGVVRMAKRVDLKKVVVAVVVGLRQGLCSIWTKDCPCVKLQKEDLDLVGQI